MKDIKKIGSFLLVVGIFFSTTGNILEINANTTNEVSEETIINDEIGTTESVANTEENREIEVENESSEQMEETEIVTSAVLNILEEDAINFEEQELLFEFIAQHNAGNDRTLMSEENIEIKDFLTTEQKEESFIVVLEENLSTQQKLDSITDLFEVSDGKRIDAAVDTVIITKDSEKSDVEFATGIQNIENVQIVEKARTFTVELEEVPNDPYYSASSNKQWELKQMQMESVWDIAKGAGVKIGVYDVGFAQAYGYPKEFNRLLPLVNFAPNGDASCYTGHTHGTTVLSIAGGVATNNGVGMASIANQATFQPYVSGFGCSPNSGSFSMSNSDFSKVYTHAINNNVDILNMSFGDSARSSVVDEATKRAYNQGLFIVASRGNSGNTVANYPACSEGALAVGALNQYNEKASFSSYGDCGHGNYIMAYGQNVSVTVNGGVGTTNGTSFSSPIVAGILGIMKSVNPSTTNQQLLQALKVTTKDLGIIGFDQNYGYGMIQPLEAIKKIHPKLLKDGNSVFYFNDDFSIKYMVEYVHGTIIPQSYRYYHSGTKYTSDYWNNVRYQFFVNGDETIKYMTEYIKESKIPQSYRYYYSGTKYTSDYWNNVRYQFFVNSDDTIKYMTEYAKRTGTVQSYRYYHSGTKYNSDYWNNVRYQFFVNSDETIKYMTEYAKRTGTAQSYRYYHSGTKYNSDYWNNVRYQFFVNSDDTIKYMEEYEPKTGKIKNRRYYYGGTKYNSNYWNKVERIDYF